MGIQIALKHNTSYTYDKSIEMGPQTIRLKPASHYRGKILGYSLNIFPENHFINWMQDPFGNFQARVVFPDPISEFKIGVEVLVDMISINPFDFFLEESAQVFPFEYNETLKAELEQSLVVTERGELLMNAFEECKKYEGYNTVDFLVALNSYVYDKVNYSIRMEPGVQTCETTLSSQVGSCRDSAWLLVQLLRHFGLAARFVSGYLVQLVPDEKAIDGPSGPDEDFTDLHAWAEVYIPGAGWIGLDATSGLFAGEGHIPLACTPHYASAAPITGVTGIANVTFDFSNSVDRILELPRVTKPYSDHQLANMHELGHQLDDMLADTGAKMTMGGEPTFISKADMESEQWNSDADGEDKRNMAMDLTLKLKNQFAENGLLHFGQGKWYPGEPVPRWQDAIYWRKDNEPLWENNSLFANPCNEGSFSVGDLNQYMIELSENLGIGKNYIIPAYEDYDYYLWEKSNLPVGFDKENDELSIQRKMLLDLMGKGMKEPSGFVIPLIPNTSEISWHSCKWDFERKSLYLVPGNSQIGHRLPLDRIKTDDALCDDHLNAENQFGEDIPLPTVSDIKKHILDRNNVSNKEKGNVFKKAFCAQLVNGNIHLFLPPISSVRHFLDLISSIEITSDKLNMPIVIEGYQPPFSAKIEKLAVTPDPGVIEVNVQPSQNWGQIVDLYDKLFTSTKAVGLSTNKFMLDGKHMGTGGGNHITLGGVSPKHSPFLRRPDVLRSMVNFWQNHPGLSYLFSSNFIGPTSQAPRVDEGRPDNLYELEIAFAELEKLKDPPFWAVDRLFRNLLTDITGNTHRAEFCIDKLYSPDSDTGRLGIVELRGFDMPPHEEMCLVQLLLIRSLFTAFWKKPYKNKVIHWGTQLHDKFMTHHFVKEDIYEVVDYLNYEGIPFDKSLLDVFLEFRFPVYGKINVGNIALTLRAGIEPWIVLGEEMSSNGTARYVDSSLERIEVTLDNFNPERYKLLCNTVEVPLVMTDYNSKYVASVRFKAWAPHSALHPTIGVNSPLVFDVYDTWNERSVGGCTYHVVHPGGRSYDSFPVNALEAESRRLTRFWDFNHSPSNNASIKEQQNDMTVTNSYVTVNTEIRENIVVKQIPPSKNFPNSLDLRRL